MTTTILEFGIIILAAIIVTGFALLIAYYIEKRKQILDLSTMIINFCLILIILLGIICIVSYYMYSWLLF